MQIIKALLLFTITINVAQTQQPLTAEMLDKAAIRFSLNAENQLEGSSREQWMEWVGANQFVGIAEVHNSAQLGFFTKAFLSVLKEKDFDHFALEMGPNSAEILKEEIVDHQQALIKIRDLNRRYGKKSSSNTPLIFVNKIEDAEFMTEASKQDYQLWGIDQEFAGSYEMLVDQMYENETNKTTDLTEAYTKAKSTIRKVIFKRKVQGQPVYCWYQSNKYINDFFSMVSLKASKEIIEDIKVSWDIYCKSANGQGSNQQRANHMKQNFNSYYEKANEKNPKVFLKLGGIHLTHGLSHYGVDDMGKFLTEKAKSNNTNFLSIRHLISYRNGKSNVGKSGWKSTSLFLEIGKKDQWTAVDLRPFRKMMENGEITVSKSIAFELKSYDILLLSPNDQYPKVNY